MPFKVKIVGKISFTYRSWQQFILKLTVFIRANLLWYYSTLTLSSQEARNKNLVSDFLNVEQYI